MSILCSFHEMLFTPLFCLTIFFFTNIFSSFLDLNELFPVIGSNETLLCQANEKIVWWTKDSTNITIDDKR